MAGPFANGLEWVNDEMNLAEGESEVNQAILSALPSLLNTLSNKSGGAVPGPRSIANLKSVQGGVGYPSQKKYGSNLLLEALASPQFGNVVDDLNIGSAQSMAGVGRGLRSNVGQIIGNIVTGTAGATLGGVPGMLALPAAYNSMLEAIPGGDDDLSRFFPEGTLPRSMQRPAAQSSGPNNQATGSAPDDPETIIRGPGPDGVYRVGGNQRYENSRGSFSRSNQSIGERLQDEAKFDKEFGDTFQGLIGQLVHAGVIPDENQISGKPDANGRRSGGLRSLANEMAASSIPRKSRAAYSPTGGQIPEEPDNSGDDSTSNTQLALMGTLIAGLVDQYAFQGAGRKMLGNQLGKIPGLGKLASKGEAKAVEAAVKANGAAGAGAKLGKKVKAVSPDAFKFPGSVAPQEPKIAADLSKLKSGVDVSPSASAARLRSARQKVEDVEMAGNKTKLAAEKIAQEKERVQNTIRNTPERKELLPAKRETPGVPAVRKGGPGTSKPGSASESPNAAKLRASRRPRLEYTPQQEKRRKSLVSQIKEATGSAKLKLKAKLKKLRDDSLPEDGF